MTTLRRVTVSLPPQVADDLTTLCTELGVSRSAFLANHLGSVLPDLLLATRALRDAGELSIRAVPRAARGTSLDELDAMMELLRETVAGDEMTRAQMDLWVHEEEVALARARARAAGGGRADR